MKLKNIVFFSIISITISSSISCLAISDSSRTLQLDELLTTIPSTNAAIIIMCEKAFSINFRKKTLMEICQKLRDAIKNNQTNIANQQRYLFKQFLRCIIEMTSPPTFNDLINISRQLENLSLTNTKDIDDICKTIDALRFD